MLVLISVSMILMTIASSGLLIWLGSKTSLTVSDELISSIMRDEKTTLYYYDNGNASKPKVLTDNLCASSLKYIYTPISKIPKRMIEAFVAIEDKRFYGHNGVDFLRSAKAIFNYTVRKSSSFGASTITQQVIKNLTGQNQRTPKRKINEIFLALNLEKKYSKDEILEIYLNIINLSNGCKGVGAASQFYYSVTPDDLSLSQTATIAAITNNPSYYDPLRHPENTIKRRNAVLLCMYDQGFITKSEYDEATSKPLGLMLGNTENKSLTWFEETVISDLISDYASLGYSREYACSQIFHGGLNIYTTVDPEIQSILEGYYEKLEYRLTTSKPAPQSAMIIIDPYSGDILGVVGATGKKQGELIQSYTSDTRRPPGSAIKPLSVYAPLIDSGEIAWSTIVEDAPTTILNDRPWPQNANRQYDGNVYIADAVASSKNTVAVRLLSTLGVQNSFEFLQNKLKIKSIVPPSEKGEGDANSVSLALGQMQNGITLRELTSAYSIFEEGIMSTSRSYVKVTDSSGNIVFDKRNNREAVISVGAAAVMTKLLEGVVDRGTAKEVISLDDKVSVAGKTGTTQGNCDRLFVGYTPSLLGGVWCGYDYPESLDSALGNPSARIWDEVMSEIYDIEGYKASMREFKIPYNVENLQYNVDTGELIYDYDNPYNDFLTDENPEDTSALENIAWGWFIKE